MVFLFEFCRKMFLQEKIETRGFYLFQTVVLLFDIENQGFVHKCLACMAGGKSRAGVSEGRGENLPSFLPVHPTPAAQAINVEILALVTCR